MKNRIVFADGTTFEQPEQAAAVVSPLKSGRAWRQIAVVGTLDEVKAKFVDGASYRQEWDSVVYNTEVNEETGEETVTETIEVQSRDLSEFSIAGEIIDPRDGTLVVLMGKPTEIELLQAQIAALTANA